MGNFLENLVTSVYRYRREIIFLWAAIFIAALLWATRTHGILEATGFEDPEAEAVRVQENLRENFRAVPEATYLIVVASDEHQINNFEFREQLKNIVNVLKKDNHIDQVFYHNEKSAGRFASSDQKASYIIATGKDLPKKELVNHAPDIRSAVHRAARDGFDLKVGGQAPFEYDFASATQKDLRTAETRTLPLVILLLFVIFGGIMAGFLPMAVGVASVVISFALLYFVGHLLPLSLFIENTVTLIGLGIAIDYALLMTNRFRKELSDGFSVRQSLAVTMRRAGEAVVFSGAVSFLGFAVLASFNFDILRSIGIGGMTIVVVSVIISITLLPALLAVLGTNVERWKFFQVSFLSREGSDFWKNFTGRIMARPFAFFAVGIVFLLLLASPALGLKRHFYVGDAFPSGIESKQAIDLIREHFAEGETSPVQIIIETSRGSFRDPEVLNEVWIVTRELQKDERLGEVRSLAALVPEMSRTDFANFFGENRDLKNPRLAEAGRFFVGADEKSALIEAVPLVNSRSADFRDLIEDLRNNVVCRDCKPITTLVGGGGAIARDSDASLYRNFYKAIAVIFIFSYLLLFFLFRSVVLPLKAIFMNLLSVLAAFGVLVAVFQYGWGSGLLNFTSLESVTSLVPVILFLIIFGISMDYEIFLLSRVKEIYEKTGDNDLAVAEGMRKTANVITGAALIMVMVFGSLAQSSIISSKEIGIGLAAAILIDTTIVRLILVPSAMKLLGKWNWWPGDKSGKKN